VERYDVPVRLPEAAPMTIWPPLLAVAGPGDASESHRHHNLHLVLARKGTIDVRAGGEEREVAGVITGPDVEHAIDASGRQAVIVFVDPESDAGADLVASLHGAARFLDAETRDGLVTGLPASPGSSALEVWARATLARLAGRSGGRPRMHPKVSRIVRELRKLAPDADTSLEALAERVGLSPSRLMHVFTESVGIPIRPYVRWLRLQRAATAIVAGAPLSEAAADAGFSDAAHMTRTFKRMFGLTPSVLQRRSRERRGRPD
jgi:AraC-like DNA-binding protein